MQDDVGMIACLSRAVGMAALLVCVPLAAGCVSVPSLTQTAERVARYEACPLGGTQLMFSAPSGAASSDRGLVMVGGFELIEVGPGERGWGMMKPVPQEALLNPETWAAPPSAVDQHLALRSRVRASLPDGEARILLFETGGHYGRTTSSVAAVRGSQGQWTVNTVNRDQPAPGSEFESTSWLLSPDQGGALDALLADPCTYAQPLQTTHSDVRSNSGWRWTLEITLPGRQIAFSGAESGFGRIGTIKRLVSHRP